MMKLRTIRDSGIRVQGKNCNTKPTVYHSKICVRKWQMKMK